MTALLPPPPVDLLDGASLFLDFDGTLVDLAPLPDAVIVDDPLRDLLARLGCKLDGRLAIVSGRAIDTLAGLFGTLPATVSGSHGLELRWMDGEGRMPQIPEALAGAQARALAFGEANPGVFIEIKPFGLGLHYRQTPEAEAACHALAESLAAEGGFHLQPGKMMIEVRLPGADKGTAIELMLADPRMAAGRPVFIGDDLTDEPGFAAARRAGGAGIFVGERRETSATYALPDVAATLAWLRGFVGEAG